MKTVQLMLIKAEAEVPHIRPEEAKGLLGRTELAAPNIRGLGYRLN